MTTAEKLQAIAENEQKVYEAGRKSQYDEFWDSVQNYGNRTDYYYGFSGYSWTAETFKPKYDIKGTRFQATFGMTNIFYASLIDILNECGVKLDTSEATNLGSMFSYTGLNEIPHIDCTNVAPSNINSLFYNATKLRKVEKLTLNSLLTYSSVFTNCVALEEIEFAGVIGKDINLQWSPKLTHDSLMSLINCLKDYSEDTSGTTHTVTIGSDNLAKLTAEEQKIARDKGWDIV